MKTSSIIFTICLMLLATYSIAQSNIKIGAGIQVNKSNYTPSSTDNVEFIYRPTLDARYILNATKKFQIEVGVGLTPRGDQYQLNLQNLMWPDQHNGMGGFDSTAVGEFGTADAYRLKSIITYIDLIAQGTYYFKEANRGIYLLGTLRPGIPLSYTSVFQETKDGKTENTRDTDIFPTSNINIFARIGIGCSIPTEGGLIFWAEVYHDQDFGRKNPIGTRINYFGPGLLAGVRF